MGEVSTVQVTQTPQFHGEARGREVPIGADNGFKSRELFLIALGSCFLANLQAAVDGRAADIHDLSVEVVGTVEDRRITTAELRVSARFSDAELIQKLVTISERGCLISNTIRDVVAITSTITQVEGES